MLFYGILCCVLFIMLRVVALCCDGIYRSGSCCMYRVLLSGGVLCCVVLYCVVVCCVI